MDYKWQKKAYIGISRIRNANEIQNRMVSRLHTMNASEYDEEWCKNMEVLADCIQATLNEMQKAVKKLKNAVSKVDDPDDSPQLSVYDDHKEVVKM